MSRTILSALFCTVVLSSGCGYNAAPLLVGSAGGAAVGAGTGAIIGSAISGGDVGASALLGGAIGLPVGLAAGMIYDHYSKRSVTGRQVDEIKNNQREILARQREIDAMREELQADIPLGNPSDSRLEYRYMGPSLGNPYR